jgi:hypothetical protein
VDKTFIDETHLRSSEVHIYQSETVTGGFKMSVMAVMAVTH